MIEKEVRALLPAWTVCALAVLITHYQAPSLAYLGLPAYLIGVAGLGAWSLGHEYAYGTMAPMLALPVPRRRWWIAKLAVLGPSLAALAALAAYFVVLDRGDRIFGVALFWLPALAALCVAPWLTMQTRSPLAGAVFTIGLVGGSMAAGEWIGVSRYGFTPDVDRFRRLFLLWAVSGVSAVGAIAGWRTFATLQDAAGRGRDWQVPARTRASSMARGLRRRPPLLALFEKELRLQQLALVVAGVYAIGSLTLLLVRRSDVFGAFEVLLALYMISMPALIGSLACAEERQFGTLDSQLLLPVATSHQWLLKALTAIGLAIVLALVLPAGLLRLLPAGLHAGPREHVFTPQGIVIVLAGVSISLYLSTLARSGMAALMYSIAAIPTLAYFDTRVGSWIGDKAFRWVHEARAVHLDHALFVPGAYFTVESFTVFVVAILALALPHYRYVDRRASRVALHAVLIAAGIVGYSVAMNVVMALRF